MLHKNTINYLIPPRFIMQKHTDKHTHLIIVYRKSNTYTYARARCRSLNLPNFAEIKQEQKLAVYPFLMTNSNQELAQQFSCAQTEKSTQLF